MPLTDPKLWNLIENWPLPHREEWDGLGFPRRLCTCFEHNLRKIGGWTDESSNAITGSYRKFLYLKALSGEPLTPPLWIDRAWHLHMSFPSNYKALEVRIGHKIAHDQTLARKERAAAWDRGRSLWAVEFDGKPSSELWPQRQESWRPFAAAGIAASGIGYAFLANVNGWTLTGGGSSDFLVVVVVVGSVLLAKAIISGPHPDELSRCG